MSTMNTYDFQLARDAFGRLMLTNSNGKVFNHVVPVRAFPITSPTQGFSLVDGEGHEIVWIDQLDALPPATRAVVEEELASREFMPEILRLHQVSSFSTPSTWQVETNRGEVEFTLKGEEDIRRLGGMALMVTDSNGLQFLIRDLAALDKNSRRLLDRFL